MSDCAIRTSVLKSRAYYVVILALLNAIDLSLRMFGYKRTYRYLFFCSPRPNPATTDFARTMATARHINRITARHFGSTPCLRRSLVLWWVLRWRHIPSDLRIGVNRKGGHAWVEHHGQVINDRLDVAEGYSVIYSEDLSPEGVSKQK